MTKSLRVLEGCVIAAGLLWMGSVQAQEKKGDTVTATGCLVKGDKAGEYSITDEGGKTYGLRSSKIKLADHLAHKVTVTGTVSKIENPKKEEAKSGKREVGDLRVTNLTMVSTSCP
jgi:hypothetical protein